MLCKFCGKENSDSAIRCENCGAYLNMTNADPAKRQNQTPKPNPNRQPNYQPGGRQFYQPGGAPPYVQPQPPAQKKSANTPLIIVLVVVGVLAVIGIVTATVMLSGSGSDKDETTTSYFDSATGSTSNQTTTQTTTESTTQTTAAPTTQTTTAEKKSGDYNMISDLTDSQHKTLNTFLSNFSEVEFADYDSRSYDSEQLINFAVIHGYVNATKAISFDYDISVDGSLTRGYIKRYFGKDIELYSTDICDYSYDYDTVFTTSEDMSSILNYTKIDYGKIYAFSTADSLKDNGDGTYEAHFYISSSDKSISKSYYSYSLKKTRSLAGVDEIAYGTATFKVKNDSFSDTKNYTLLTYDVTYE